MPAYDEYKRNPEYANGMLDAWKAMHAEMRAQSAKGCRDDQSVQIKKAAQGINP